MTAAANWQRVIDGNGLSVSITGMLIVFCSLAIISIFIFLLPKTLVLVAKFFPEKEEAAARPTGPDDRAVAAIGYVLHQRLLARRQSS